MRRGIYPDVTQILWYGTCNISNMFVTFRPRRWRCCFLLLHAELLSEFKSALLLEQYKKNLTSVIIMRFLATSGSKFLTSCATLHHEMPNNRYFANIASLLTCTARGYEMDVNSCFKNRCITTEAWRDGSYIWSDSILVQRRFVAGSSIRTCRVNPRSVANPLSLSLIHQKTYVQRFYIYQRTVCSQQVLLFWRLDMGVNWITLLFYFIFIGPTSSWLSVEMFCAFDDSAFWWIKHPIFLSKLIECKIMSAVSL